jgi:hypothetical protein
VGEWNSRRSALKSWVDREWEPERDQTLPYRGNPSPPSQSFVYLSATDWSFHGPSACWQEPVFSTGGTVLLGGTFEGSVSLLYPGGTTGPNCTAESVQVLTTGFLLQGSNAPITVAPGADEYLFVNVTVPSATYSGALAMSITVVSP